MEVIETSQKRKRQNPLDYPTQLLIDRSLPFLNDSWYKTIIQTTLDGFWLSDMDGNILETNDSMCRMLGYGQQELIKMKISDIDIRFINDPEKLKQDILQHRIDGGAFFEAQHKCKDGHIIDVSVSLKYLDIEPGYFFCFHRDITEQKKSRQQMKESEDRYRALIELSGKVGEAVVMLQDTENVKGLQIFVSNEWAHISGYTKEELLQMSFFDLLHPGYRKSSLIRHNLKVKSHNLPQYFEMVIIRKDGKEIPIEITSGYANYMGTRVNVAYIRDITERKIVEQKLLQSNKRYKNLFENAAIAVAERDFTEVKKYFDYIEKQGVTNIREYFKNQPEQILICYNLTKLIGFNPALLDFYEAKNAQEILAMVIESIKSRTEYWQFFYDIYTNLAEGKTQFQMEEKVRTIKGINKTGNLIVTVVPGCENNLSRVYLSIIDITELKNKAQELLKYQQHLEEMVKKRTQQIENTQKKLKKTLRAERKLTRDLQNKIIERVNFTRALVHELKTPLTPVIACSEGLLSSLKQEPELSLANNINIGANRLYKKVDDLADLAKGEAGILKLNCRRTNPLTIIEEATSYFDLDIKNKGYKIVVDLPKELPKIKADKERIIQVLFNLLDNAVKYSPYNKTINVKAYRQDSWLKIEISDKGIGIEEQNKKYLFQPYKRFTKTKKNIGGLGLGLYISKLIIDLHKGNISVISEKGVGSTFIVSLPVS